MMCIMCDDTGSVYGWQGDGYRAEWDGSFYWCDCPDGKRALEKMNQRVEKQNKWLIDNE